jgi:hypothetical protein
MLEPIGPRLIEARLRDMGQAATGEMVILFKGATFALAAVLLLEIAMDPDGRVVRLLFWSGSFCLAIASYNAHINTAVVHFRENVLGVVWVTVQMMSELMLFVVLTARFAADAWRYWGFVYAVFLVVTGLRLIVSRLHDGFPIEPSLVPLYAGVEGRRKRSAAILLGVFTPVALALSIAVIAVPKTSPWSMPAAIALGVFGLAQAIYGIRLMHMQREEIERLLVEALAKDAG